MSVLSEPAAAAAPLHQAAVIVWCPTYPWLQNCQIMMVVIYLVPDLLAVDKSSAVTGHSDQGGHKDQPLEVCSQVRNQDQQICRAKVVNRDASLSSEHRK